MVGPGGRPPHRFLPPRPHGSLPSAPSGRFARGPIVTLRGPRSFIHCRSALPLRPFVLRGDARELTDVTISITRDDARASIVPSRSLVIRAVMNLALRTDESPRSRPRSCMLHATTDAAGVHGTKSGMRRSFIVTRRCKKERTIGLQNRNRRRWCEEIGICTSSLVIRREENDAVGDRGRHRCAEFRRTTHVLACATNVFEIEQHTCLLKMFAKFANAHYISA